LPIVLGEELLAPYPDVNVPAVLKAQKEQGAPWDAGKVKSIQDCIFGRIRISHPDDALIGLPNIGRKGISFEGYKAAGAYLKR
jgi:hypothetical protein